MYGETLRGQKKANQSIMLKEWSKDAKETLYNDTLRTLQGRFMSAGRTLEDPY